MDYAQEAIKSAMEGRWKEAIAANLALLKDNPKDVDTLNRLGRSYFETGQKTKALETYQKVVKLDKFNTIAIKNISFIKTTKISREKTVLPAGFRPPMFLEEPGVTKTVSLIRLGDPKVLSKLHPADLVKIVSRQHNVCVVTTDNEYLGRLPDDLASRMREFINGGNLYSAWVRSVTPSLKVFLKEDSRAPKFRHTPSFPLTEKLSYAAFTPPELIHEEKPDVSATEEQEESFFGSDNEGESERKEPKEFSAE